MLVQGKQGVRPHIWCVMCKATTLTVICCRSTQNTHTIIDRADIFNVPVRSRKPHYYSLELGKSHCGFTHASTSWGEMPETTIYLSAHTGPKYNLTPKLSTYMWTALVLPIHAYNDKHGKKNTSFIFFLTPLLFSLAGKHTWCTTHARNA